MKSEASKWNARYAYSGRGIPPPAQVLSRGVRWLPEVDAQVSPQTAEAPRALDLACGRAANGQFLADRGFKVSAWDISENVIQEIRTRNPFVLEEALVRDVSTHPPEPDSFDVIVVSRFLDRKLCSAISGALKPQGVLFYQTFVHGLSNPDYLLAPNELLSLFSDLHVLEYHEPEKDVNGKAEAQFVGMRKR
ncbi:MAG: class I SAM-dependent methyltransferase [Granulosicoccus sp.]